MSARFRRSCSCSVLPLNTQVENAQVRLSANLVQICQSALTFDFSADSRRYRVTDNGWVFLLQTFWNVKTQLLIFTLGFLSNYGHYYLNNKVARLSLIGFLHTAKGLTRHRAFREEVGPTLRPDDRWCFDFDNLDNPAHQERRAMLCLAKIPSDAK
jgi:hypothetical protein